MNLMIFFIILPKELCLPGEAPAVLSCVSFWIILQLDHNAARALLSHPKKPSAKSTSAFGSSLLIHERRKTCPGSLGWMRVVQGWNAPEHCYHCEILGVVLVVEITFIYFPAPPKNVRIFVVLAVPVTEEQFHTHCDKPEAIVLKDGLDLHFRGGILITQTLRDKKKKGCGLCFTAHFAFLAWDFSSWWDQLPF